MVELKYPRRMNPFSRPFSPRQLRATVLIILYLTWQTAGCALAEEQQSTEPPWTFSIYFENDLFTGTDRNYTNGIKLALISPDLKKFADSGKLPDWSLKYVKKLPFINKPDPELTHKVEFSIGQNMYTPADISSAELIPDDRPYAGWSYFGAGFHTKSQRMMDTIELQFGMVGPDSGADETQKLVHELRRLQRPNGWEHQLKNEPGFAAIYERKWRLPAITSPDRWGFDAVAHLGCALGNVYTYANTGLEARFGYHLPDDFGVTLIRPAGNTRFSTNDQRGGYIFAAINGRAVARDIFLDGNTLADSHHVTKEPLVTDIAGGVALYFQRFKITWTQLLRTKEFKAQPDNHSFGSITFSFFF
ncbi:MAG: lipid A deacylase LpxR family protein [Desulfobulbaceae bacterium]|nr:lipid A deacylase LpxR family protein [Desulfobulbaceae bacterium]HIJ78474.1 lipid A deacylase LpxR family protein [Deltaproteobacteria bacterium]